MTSPVKSPSYGLRSDALGKFETLAQSISCLAPTSTPAVLIPLVFVNAGNGTWLAYLLATLALVLVAANINQFASRSTSPGSLYTYVAIGLGPGMGLLTGWLILFGYMIVFACVLAQFALYAVPLVHSIFHITIDPIYLMIFCFGLASYIAWCDIKLSASVMLIIEICSITFILILMAITLFHKGYVIDWAQIKFTGVNAKGLLLGLVFSLFGFTGFESAASLGSETKEPLKNIPYAIMYSCLWSGIFYAICAYVMVIGFSNNPKTLVDGNAILIDLAALNGLPWLGIILSCGAVISFFACAISCINTASRLMFIMGHHGLLPAKLSYTHKENQTPHIAIAFVTILGIIPALVLVLLKCTLIEIITWTGALAAYSFILTYAFISIAAPVHLRELGCLKRRDIIIAVTSFIAMIAALIGNINPNAKGVEQFLPHIFISVIIAGALWYLYLKVFAPQTVQLMATDMEAIRTRFLQNEKSHCK